MDDAYSIIIEFHNLLACDIKRVVNEIATMRGPNFLPFLGSYKLSIFWLFFWPSLFVSPVWWFQPSIFYWTFVYDYFVFRYFIYIYIGFLWSHKELSFLAQITQILYFVLRLLSLLGAGGFFGLIKNLVCEHKSLP